ncbi:MAG: trimeric intracellular cation channel family protein [Muribaculaceae bacterium]
MESLFLLIVEIVGTMAFAISGIRLAAAKKFDWFGAYAVGLATAIGGGTFRDILLNAPIFWMHNGWYLGVTGLSLAAVIVFKKSLVRLHNTIFIFDTIGLALFVVIGIQKTLTYGYPMWTAIMMRTITGALGGVIRDILINEEPLIFRKDVYATACIMGGIIFWVISELGGSSIVQQLVCSATVIVIRILAARYNWSIPILRGYADSKNDL